MSDEAKNIGDAVGDLDSEQGLMQFAVGNQRYGVIVGRLGYIVTENDFCYQVRSLKENIELKASWSWEPSLFQLLTLPEIRAIAIPITSYREWAHYWGIKPRIKRNYEDMARHAVEIGADIGPLPEWGEEPDADESAKRPISVRGNLGQASKSKSESV